MDPLKLDDIQKLLEKFKTETEASINKCIAEGMSKNDERIKTMETSLIATEDAMKQMDEKMKKQAAYNASGGPEADKKQPFDLGRYVAALYHKANANSNLHADPWLGAEYEKERCEDYAKTQGEDVYVQNVGPHFTKAQIAGDGTQGGYMVVPEVTNEIIDMVIADMPIMDFNPTVLRGLVGDLPVPTITSRHAGYWLGENEAPTVSEAAFGQKWLRPKKAGAFTKQSNRLIYQSRGVSDRVIKELLKEEMLLTIEQGLISGSGADSQPLGIENQTGIMTATTATVTNNRFKIDDAAVMEEDIDNANELKNSGNFGYLMHPRIRGGLKRQTVKQYAAQASKDAQPIMAINPIMSNKVLEDVIGYPIKTTTLINNARGSSGTDSNVYFGNWKLFWIAFWRDLILRVSDTAGNSSGSAFLKDQMWIVAFQEVDCQLMRGTAFTYLTGSDTNKSNWS